MSSKLWRWAAALAGMVTVVAILIWAFQPQVVDVETTEAQVQPFEEWVEDDGRARVRERVAVTMPWAGALERPTLKEGHAVEPDEPLFWVRPVQPSLLDARTRAEAQARSAAAQAAWQRAARQTEVALVAWQRAAVNAARAVMLAEQSFVSRAQVETTVLDLQRDERSWQAAQAAERAALHELEQARVALGSGSSFAGGSRRAVRAMDAMGQGIAVRSDAATAVRSDAPTALRVLRVAQPHEAVLGAGVVVMDVGDVRNPEVVVPLLSQDALRIREGSAVHLSAWGRRDEGGSPSEAVIQGRVRLIEPVATTKVSALGLEEQRVNVVIEPEQALPPGDGYTVRVQIALRQEREALQVPISAVFPEPGHPSRHAVFTVENGRAHRRPVEVQGRGSGRAWIAGGLKAGEAVVVFPPASLQEGSRVRARP